MDDLISRLTRGIGIINEKLDHILTRIEEVELHVESARPAEIERQIHDIIDDLNLLESPISQLFQDVDVLKSHNHSGANDFYRQYVFIYLLRQ